MLTNPHFCCFCVLEAHVQGILGRRQGGMRQVLPLSVIMMIQRIGNGMFELGKQSDAQEFLFTLLDNLTQASFGYLRGVPFSYEK